MQQTLLAPRALNLIRDPLYTYTRKLEFLILILTVDDFASRSLGRRSLRSCANRLRAWPENCNRCWTKRGDMDKNPNQSNEEDLSAQLRETRHVLEELGNYQGTQMHLATSSQVNRKEQLETITSTMEQVNQMLLTSLQRLEDSGDRQNEASRKVILSDYKAFEESVEQTASRNETQLRKMHDEQRYVNERLLRLQSKQKSGLDSLAYDVTRHLDEALVSLDRQASEQIRRMSNRLG